jgi:hypothetical protein
MAPAVGFEPTTNRLTADRSTTELRWIVGEAQNVAHEARSCKHVLPQIRQDLLPQKF